MNDGLPDALTLMDDERFPDLHARRNASRVRTERALDVAEPPPSRPIWATAVAWTFAIAVGLVILAMLVTLAVACVYVILQVAEALG